MPRLVSIGTALPPHPVDQSHIRDSALEHFGAGLGEIRRLISVFDNVQVKRRYFCVPIEWLRSEHSFSERNSAYVRWAQKLSIRAIQCCLEQAGVGCEEIDHIVFVSTSGLSTPSIDARIMNRLAFGPHTRRTPLFGLGCAGGAAGLARCLELCRGSPEQRFLLVAVEISSLTFQTQDLGKSNLVASALFSDGAAAALVCGDRCREPGVELVDSLSTLWPDTLEVMGWDFGERGLGVIFSRSIPFLLKKHIRNNIQCFLDRRSMSLDDLDHFAVHPGGAKVLASVQASLGLEAGSLRHSRSVLENFGNMSSPTVLFILKRLLENGAPSAGQYGLCAAFGPGFSSELVLLRWC